MMKKKYMITAALPYANGPVHIGHLAGVYIPADIYARYLRKIGNDVAFICGSDEHGVPITINAKKEGVSPKDIVDKYHKIIKKSFEDFGISFDKYSRTSSNTHKETASDFFLQLENTNKLEEKISNQLYDEKNNQFLSDRFVIGTCPKCGSEESYGDQCEKCGTSHNATDLINPKSVITGNTPIQKETKHWFLPLHKYEDFLKKWILEGHKKDWKQNVYGQVKSWLDEGLHSRAVTRDLDWGVPVPMEGGKGKVLYVWFDAPIGYISFTKEWATEQNKNWEDYWKEENTKIVNFIGKDNIVFHCIIFPVMLKAYGSFQLPDNVPANEFLNLEGNKISTSKKWAVWLHEYLKDFPDMQDVLRYVLTANAPETKDNDFTWKDFQAKNNNELVAILGNFINRVVVLTHKYYDGFIPSPSDILKKDKEVLEKIKQSQILISKSIESYHFREALSHFMNLSRLGNKYLADEEPWKKIKLDEERVKTIMYISLQIVGSISILSEIFIPFTHRKLKHILGIENLEYQWNDILTKSELLKPKHKINKPELLFSKIEDLEIQKQIKKLEEKKESISTQKKEISTQKKTITFEDFNKNDIRIGTIIDAKKIPKTKKLLELKVDIGIGIRTIVSGIGAFFIPENIINKKVAVLINLEPRKIRGVESQGMILMTETAEGKLVFMTPEEKVENGNSVR